MEFSDTHPVESLPIRARQKQQAELKRTPLPPYAVVLHNDEINTFEFVVGVVQRVFKYSIEKAYRLTDEAHIRGRCIVWSGSLEVAELKADQIRSCGPDPETAWRGAKPLQTTIEAQ